MPPTSDRLLADKTLERLRAVSVATVTMQLLKRGLRHTFIQGPRPLNPQHARFAAEAYTLRTIPMREDLSTLEVLADPEYPQRKAIEACPPGQVLVCDCRGEQRAGALGDILITRLMVRGVAAFVTDGPMRDAAAVAAIEFPTFCTGSAAPASLAAHFAAARSDRLRRRRGVPWRRAGRRSGRCVRHSARHRRRRGPRRRRAGTDGGVHPKTSPGRRARARHVPAE